MSLVSLLLAGLNTRFAAAGRASAVTDECYAQLRAYRRGLEQAGGDQHPPVIYSRGKAFALHPESDPS